jgi:hypothetical protein
MVILCTSAFCENSQAEPWLHNYFLGMIMLEIDPELNTNIGVYEILHPLTKNVNFSVYKQGFMNFMLMTVVMSVSESCHE